MNLLRRMKTMTSTVPQRTTRDIYSYSQQALDLLEIRMKEGDMSYDNYLECKKLLDEQLKDELSTHYLPN